MKKYKTVMQETAELDGIFCDRCGNSLREKPSSNYCGIHFLVSGNYSSKYFPDIPEADVKVDVCEECAADWFKSFKNNPLDYPQDQ
jgi:hypothetical protein